MRINTTSEITTMPIMKNGRYLTHWQGCKKCTFLNCGGSVTETTSSAVPQKVTVSRDFYSPESPRTAHTCPTASPLGAQMETSLCAPISWWASVRCVPTQWNTGVHNGQRGTWGIETTTTRINLEDIKLNKDSHCVLPLTGNAYSTPATKAAGRGAAVRH